MFQWKFKTWIQVIKICIFTHEVLHGIIPICHNIAGSTNQKMFHRNNLIPIFHQSNSMVSVGAILNVLDSRRRGDGDGPHMSDSPNYRCAARCFIHFSATNVRHTRRNMTDHTFAFRASRAHRALRKWTCPVRRSAKLRYFNLLLR